MTKSDGLTVGELAHKSGLSRSALLYYDRLGLLRASGRSSGNYRLYGPGEVARLEQIRLYRGMGIPLKEIRPLLEQTRPAGKTESILHRRLATLKTQMEMLHDQQRQIVQLLEELERRRTAGGGGRARRDKARPVGCRKRGLTEQEKDMVSKERWVEIMTAAGLSDQDKHNWHRQFEKMEPEAHQEFLESLGIAPDEIARIREWSRG